MRKTFETTSHFSAGNAALAPLPVIPAPPPLRTPDRARPIQTPRAIESESAARSQPEPVGSTATKSGPWESHHVGDRLCRFVNVAVAVVGLILTAPLMLLIAALIKATSRGPVIFSQPRVGVDRRGRADPRNGDRRTIDSRRRGGVTASSGGRRSHEGRERRDEDRRASDRGGAIFTIHKFRTMRTEDDSAQVWARKDDSRITPLGRVLRATRLDELPQLFNVLRGNMNVVGPRPEQPEIFAELSEELGHYRQRQRVLPGITGLAQVNLGYDQTIDDVRRKVDLDLEYIRRRSAFEDLKIMAQTMPVMVFQKVWM